MVADSGAWNARAAVHATDRRHELERRAEDIARTFRACNAPGQPRRRLRLSGFAPFVSDALSARSHFVAACRRIGGSKGPWARSSGSHFCLLRGDRSLRARFQRQPVFALALYLHSMTLVFLGMSIASSAGEMLFNKEEADILLHRPVTPRRC
jgi:hypothetical protein